MVDDAGTLIDMVSRDSFDYVSDVCPVCNKLWEQTERFAGHNSELEVEIEDLKAKLDYEKRMHSKFKDEALYLQNRLDDLVCVKKENEQLKYELKGMEELLKSYRKTIEHDAKLLADATKNGYLPPLEDWKGDVE